MGFLVQMIQPDNDGQLIKSALNTLINFATDKTQIVNFKNANGLNSLLGLLENLNPEIQGLALQFFQKFNSASDLNKDIARAIGFVPRAIGLLTSAHLGNAKAALQSLTAFASYQKGAETISASGGIPPLSLLLISNDPQVSEASVKLLHSLVTFQDRTLIFF
jgi:copper homeostasis protein CutC